jgi:HPt (histidine-containing phosphotransfer) domain-containing protein
MDSSPQDQPPRIPGIDIPDLLERIGDDVELMWDVLTEFSATYRDTPVEIAALIDSDPAEAKRRAHTLKGVLGNLSAQGLFETCRALDEAIRAGEDARYPALLTALEEGVPRLCDAIDAAARGQSPPPPEPMPPAPGDWLGERYQGLLTALAGHRARDCKTLVQEIAGREIPPAERPFFEEIQALVRGYRFKEAQELLERRVHG